MGFMEVAVGFSEQQGSSMWALHLTSLVITVVLCRLVSGCRDIDLGRLVCGSGNVLRYTRQRWLSGILFV